MRCLVGLDGLLGHGLLRLWEQGEREAQKRGRCQPLSKLH